MVTPASDTPNTESPVPGEPNPTDSPSMGSHGWSRIVMAIILLGALATVVVRGIYVVTHLDAQDGDTAQVDAP